MSEIPDKIYLVLHEGLSIQSADWSIERINPDDIEYVRAPEWVSVSERLPEHGQYVWFLDANNGEVYKGQYVDDPKSPSFYWVHTTGFTIKRQAAYWQPYVVPAPPEAQ